jgi:hypothetical protein
MLGTHFERERRGRHYTHVQHMRPIAYADAAGRIRRIVSDWQDGGEDWPHLVTAAPFLVSVTNGGEVRYHPTRDPDVYFIVGDPHYRLGGDVKQYDLGTPARSGNTLTWQTQHLRMDYRHAGSAGKLGMLFKTDAYQNVDDREIAFPITYQGCSRQGRNILVAGQPRMLLAPSAPTTTTTRSRPPPSPTNGAPG